MKLTKNIAMGVVGAAGLVWVGASALAHPGWYGGMGRGMGPCAAASDAGAACPMMGPGAMRGRMGAGCAVSGPGAGPRGAAVQPLMTDEERQAFWDKMRTAKTPEERQKLALEHRAEVQKRAAERGIEFPPMRGPGMGYGRGPGMGYGWGPGRGNAPESAPQ